MAELVWIQLTASTVSVGPATSVSTAKFRLRSASTSHALLRVRRSVKIYLMPISVSACPAIPEIDVTSTLMSALKILAKMVPIAWIKSTTTTVSVQMDGPAKTVILISANARKSNLA